MVLATDLSISPFCLLIILKRYFVVRLIISHSKGYLPSSAKVAMLLEGCFVPKHCLQKMKFFGR